MFSPSDYNDAVPQFTNGNYANTPLNPLYVEEPDAVNYNRGSEPLQTLPAQWWNWLLNKITSKLNNLNIYVKNIFDELTGLLSVVGETPDATSEDVTTEQLKDMFATKYGGYLSEKYKFESILQGRTRGVMVSPTDSWDVTTHTLSLTGGFGILDSYKKINFSTVDLILPNDSNSHYIVSSSDGVISIKDLVSDNEILIGLCHDDEYLLCKDFVFDQGVDTIKLHKWYGESKITNALVSPLQAYYNTTVGAVETIIDINRIFTDQVFTTENIPPFVGIGGGTFNNCQINIQTIEYMSTDQYDVYFANTIGIGGGTFNNCQINIQTIGHTASLGYESESEAAGIGGGTFNNCKISIQTIERWTGIGHGNNNLPNIVINNCQINAGQVGIGNSNTQLIASYSVSKTLLTHCNIFIGSVYNNTYTRGIESGTLIECVVVVSSDVGNKSLGLGTGNKYYFVHVTKPQNTSATSVDIGKGLVVNNTTVKGF